jgi:hypothetical protein
MEELNNSGQDGFVTLFDRGPRTAIVVAVDGAGNHVERIAIARGNDCDKIGKEVARLNDVQNGISRGYVDLKKDELMSNKYLTVVYGSVAPDAKPVACGQLFT